VTIINYVNFLTTPLKINRSLWISS